MDDCVHSCQDDLWVVQRESHFKLVNEVEGIKQELTKWYIQRHDTCSRCNISRSPSSSSTFAIIRAARARLVSFPHRNLPPLVLLVYNSRFRTSKRERLEVIYRRQIVVFPGTGIWFVWGISGSERSWSPESRSVGWFVSRTIDRCRWSRRGSGIIGTWTSAGLAMIVCLLETSWRMINHPVNRFLVWFYRNCRSR